MPSMFAGLGSPATVRVTETTPFTLRSSGGFAISVVVGGVLHAVDGGGVGEGDASGMASRKAAMIINGSTRENLRAAGRAHAAASNAVEALTEAEGRRGRSISSGRYRAAPAVHERCGRRHRPAR